MTVGDLIQKLNFGLSNGYLLEKDEIFLITPDKTVFVDNIALPKVIFKDEVWDGLINRQDNKMSGNLIFSDPVYCSPSIAEIKILNPQIEEAQKCD